MRNAVQLEVTVDGVVHQGVTALTQNSDPFTYFGKQPIHVCENCEIDDGSLGMVLLSGRTSSTWRRIVPRLLSTKLSATKHRQVETFEHLMEATIRSLSGDEEGEIREFPVQVDGDYIGQFEQITLKAAPGALTIIA